MKKLLLGLIMVSLVGCTHVGGQSLGTYFDEPQTLIRDPHFNSYKDSLDALESEYLKKKITFAEYQEKKKELDLKYAKEVQDRENIMSGNDQR